MTVLLIAYDLVDAEAGAEINALIRTVGQSWARPLATVWYVQTNLTPEVVKAQIAECLGMDDGLVVQRVDSEAVGHNLSMRWTRSLASDERVERKPCQIIALPRRVFQDAA